MTSFFLEYGLLGLFLISFLAATFFPISSEVVLVLLLKSHPLWHLILVASIGNILGSILNFYIGTFGKIEWSEKYLKIKHTDILKWQNQINRFGPYMAILCWVPIIGDVISVALGYFKVSFIRFVIFLSIGKSVRYIVLAYMVSKI